LKIPKSAWDTLEASRRDENSTSALFVKAFLLFSFYDSRCDSLVLALNNGRYINHGPKASTTTTLWRDDGVDYTVFTRDIEAGIEIEDDFLKYDVCPWKGFAFEWEPLVPGYAHKKHLFLTTI